MGAQRETVIRSIILLDFIWLKEIAKRTNSQTHSAPVWSDLKEKQEREAPPPKKKKRKEKDKDKEGKKEKENLQLETKQEMHFSAFLVSEIQAPDNFFSKFTHNFQQ